MDPPTMDYMMGHPEHHPQVASSHASSASACPALQHASMFSTNQPQYPFNPHHHWQRLPLPYAQWGPDPPFHASSSIMQSSNTSQVDQQQYPPSGQEVYNPHQSSAFRNAVSMPGLQRVGGTAPIQHSQQHNQGNLANPIHSRPQGGIAGGAAAENQMHGSRLNGQNGQNGALPSINSVRPLTSQNLQSFVHPARPTLGQHSPPPFIRQTSSPSTAVTTNSAEATVASSTESARSLPHQGTQSPPRRAPTTAARTAEMSNEGSASSARQAGATRNRRGLSRLPSSESGWSSDDDSDHGAVALTLLDAAASGPVGESAQDERTRTQQLLRGAVMNNKRVASKRAITSLESVAISSLPENERTCVICYNDYGAETPEGICEIPLRLPKCKHVFGDHCIKKWFEESDSCPYCRDKVPSEPHNRHSMMLQQMGAHNLYRFLRTQHTHHQQARSNREQERAMELLGENAAGRMNAMATNPWSDVVEFGPSGNPPARRMDPMPMYNSRTPTWHSNLGDRHSPLPFSEVSDNRRRARPRHGSLRGLPQGRPQSTAVAPNGSPQTSQYPWPGRPNVAYSHNRQQSASSNTTARPTFDTNNTPFPLQPQMGAPTEPYLNPLNMTSFNGAGEEYSSLPHMRPHRMPPMSPTYPGPEVFMTNADDSVYGGAMSHQQI